MPYQFWKWTDISLVYIESLNYHEASSNFCFLGILKIKSNQSFMFLYSKQKDQSSNKFKFTHWEMSYKF